MAKQNNMKPIAIQWGSVAIIENNDWTIEGHIILVYKEEKGNEKGKIHIVFNLYKSSSGGICKQVKIDTEYATVAGNAYIGNPCKTIEQAKEACLAWYKETFTYL